jgi:hypothetical protein
MATDNRCSGDLMDYETGDYIGPATEDQCAASDSEISGTGAIAIDEDGNPLREDETHPRHRRVYVEE